MKNTIKNISFKAFLFVFLFTSINVFSQNKEIEVKAEKVEEGIKVTTKENGKTKVVILDMKDAEEYLKKLGDNINIDLEETGDNIYKLTYSSKDGEPQTIEIDIDEMIEEFSLSIENIATDLEKAIEEIASSIEYEEIEDENGNKIIKIKSVKAVK